MRLVALVLFCASAMLALGGCNAALDRQYFTQGVGTKLYTDAVADRTNAEDLYVKYICQRAGLTPTETLGGGMSCGYPPDDPATWWQFVQAGMNDIDQRCDGYLAWLDNVRRAEKPTLAEITDAGTAATLIMNATRVGAGPIAVVAAAFGFASNTFTNVNSRLILEFDHSTVQAVVLSHQKQFREDLLGTADHKAIVRIHGRPSAIYALRSYLRLCMPMTIETQINNIVATFERGGVDALKNSKPMISARSVGIPVIRSTRPPPPTPKVPKAILGAVGPIEPHISLRRGKGFQRTLCVKDTGDFGQAGLPVGQAPATRAQLREFNAAFRYGVDVPIDQLLSTTPDTVATPKDLNNLSRAHTIYPSCQNANLKNGFEVGIVTRYSVPTVKKQVLNALTAKQIPVPAKFDVKTDAVDPPLRAAIMALRKKFDGGPAQLDPKFYDWLVRAHSRN